MGEKFSLTASRQNDRLLTKKHNIEYTTNTIGKIYHNK